MLICEHGNLYSGCNEHMWGAKFILVADTWVFPVVDSYTTFSLLECVHPFVFIKWWG